MLPALLLQPLRIMVFQHFCRPAVMIAVSLQMRIPTSHQFAPGVAPKTALSGFGGGQTVAPLHKPCWILTWLHFRAQENTHHFRLCAIHSFSSERLERPAGHAERSYGQHTPLKMQKFSLQWRLAHRFPEIPIK